MNPDDEDAEDTQPVVPETAVDVRTPDEYAPVDHRTVMVSLLAATIAAGASLAAQFLTRLIALVTNAAFYHRVSTVFVSPAGAPRSVIIALTMPVLGALIVGLMARYGTAAIRGHGIPEVMEKVLFGQSRIPARVLVLKPLSAAVAIGTGGPFGAEGPIIATGGALGSLAGQFLPVSADERKTLLASGAAAGMAATFGTPVSAVLLAVELLLFEYRARSLIPVALAAVTATGVRALFEGTAPIFEIAVPGEPSGSALFVYALLGAALGVVAAGITQWTYLVEDLFERLGKRLRIHWMWWPAIGAVAVGIIGAIDPRTLGVGYENIVGSMSGTIVGTSLLVLAALKLTSWSLYLGSGTSGGTMAPLFTVGSAAGAWIGGVVAGIAPGLGVQPSVAGLVGMAAMFAGASHALLASVVMAFETTRQPLGLLPLLAGCTASYLVALLFSRHSIMTEKLARRGSSVRTEYAADHLAHVSVRDAMTTTVVSLTTAQTIDGVRTWLASRETGTSHQGFPVLDDTRRLVGVVTRRDLLDLSHAPDKTIADVIARRPVVVWDDSSLRDAADLMVLERVGRLPVVRREDPRTVVGMISRSDLLSAHEPRLEAARETRRVRTRLFRREPPRDAR